MDDRRVAPLSADAHLQNLTVPPIKTWTELRTKLLECQIEEGQVEWLPLAFSIDCVARLLFDARIVFSEGLPRER
jgi:hypothetical protein